MKDKLTDVMQGKVMDVSKAPDFNAALRQIIAFGIGVNVNIVLFIIVLSISSWLSSRAIVLEMLLLCVLSPLIMLLLYNRLEKNEKKRTECDSSYPE